MDNIYPTQPYKTSYKWLFCHGTFGQAHVDLTRKLGPTRGGLHGTGHDKSRVGTASTFDQQEHES